ncbi:MAG: hypothetical protein LBO67_03260 [Spirochaetaceae bacterium]|nr:hypothetical protein [Spirochaetaceae bacterium]
MKEIGRGQSVAKPRMAQRFCHYDSVLCPLHWSGSEDEPCKNDKLKVAPLIADAPW